MNMLHSTQADYLTPLWSGGTTTQIAIFPSDTPYSTRDFLWRVSSAVVTDEKSIFTPPPRLQPALNAAGRFPAAPPQRRSALPPGRLPGPRL